MKKNKKIKEYSGAAGRIDFSGVRGGLNRPLSNRDSDYPYDKDTTYGSAAFDKSLTQGKDAQDNSLVPKNIEHTHWKEDDELEKLEAIGTPTNFTKSGTSNMGSAVPGSSQGWSSYKEADEMTDDELSTAASSYQNMLPAKKNQFAAGMQRRNMNGRESKMSNTWKAIHEAYVSLKDTPKGEMTLAQSVDEAELEAVMQEFEEQSSCAEKYLDEVDEIEGIKFLFQLDPDHAANSLKDVGKDKIKNTYKSWADRSMSNQQPSDEELD